MISSPYHSLKIFLITLLLVAGANRGFATHIVGGEVSYRFIDSVAGGNRYAINLAIYEDCLNGTPQAIASDAQAFYAIYNGLGILYHFDSVLFATSESVPANFSNACVTNAPELCLLKKTFVFTVILPPDPTGYIIEYVRCCRNASVVNLVEPAHAGGIYYCTIPPPAAAIHNNSAVFLNYPPQIICVNTPLVYNNSATDPDGDSLSYELCEAYSSDETLEINAVPPPPPFPPAMYQAAFSYSAPITSFPPIEVDARTGIISGTPNHIGRYLVTICCSEWRNGIKINTVKREFQFVVTSCSKAVTADIPLHTSYPNTYELNCQDYTIHFNNTSVGGFSYTWDFGVPGAPQDHSFEPTFVYPDTGTFTVKLIVNPGETCPDSIFRLVKVYPRFSTSFSYDGSQCVGTPVNFIDQSVNTIKPVTQWQWYFGDGTTSGLQNPDHAYASPGTFYTMLVSENIKLCRDTAVHEVIIQNFKPYAGDDTIIVKGEHVHFDGHGGTQYTWTPSLYLDDTGVHDPWGYFPDTGTFFYRMFVQSAYGCGGYDDVRVRVVDKASFFIPTGFSPNGDGLNDYFRPMAVGYKELRYLRVFNRWGECVYYGTDLEVGWNGKYKGQLSEMGVYFWEISYVDRFGKDGFMKGDVTLLR